MELTGTRVEVIADTPASGTYTYIWPGDWGPPVPGTRVLIPFGRRTLSGYVAGPSSATLAAAIELKPLIDILDPEPVLVPAVLELTRWAAGYYQTAWSQLIRAAVPWRSNPRSIRYAAVTPAGRALVLGETPGAASLPLREREILELLTARGAASMILLRKELGSPSLHRAVRNLELKHLLEVTERIAGRARTGWKTERWLTLLPAGRTALTETDPDGPKWQRILWMLRAAPDGLRFRDIARQIRAPESAARKLLGERLIAEELRRVERQADLPEGDGRPPPSLFAEQAAAVEAVRHSFGVYQPFLLFGVTGSGKTEVYLRLMSDVIARGEQGLVLVPEIALTPLMLSRFRGRFGNKLAVLHSALGEAVRVDEWNRVRHGEAAVAVGVRSAVFAPAQRLGLIVVDEEHDASYKQDRSPFYHARDLAIVRGKHAGCPVILGSATPSAESYHHAQNGRYRLVLLNERIESRPLPRLSILDAREMGRKRKADQPPAVLHRELAQGITDALARSEQVILFLNRRGYAPSVVCPSCGFLVTCPHCSLGLVYHADIKRLLCHSCGYEDDPPQKCPGCSEAVVVYRGVGTQRIEEHMRKEFANVSVIRLDTDAVQRKGSRTRLLEAFGAGRANVLIGTQMVAKGHDFPRVTVVGVLGLDAMLSLPDFRAAERAFALLIQAAGRSGRGERPGVCHIQTMFADHYVVRKVIEHDVTGFYHEEFAMRRRLGLPPFTRLALLRLDSPGRRDAFRAASWLAKLLLPLCGKHDRIMGPAPAPVIKRRDIYTWQLLVKSPSPAALTTLLQQAASAAKLLKKDFNSQLLIDRDPYSFL